MGTNFGLAKMSDPNPVPADFADGRGFLQEVTERTETTIEPIP